MPKSRYELSSTHWYACVARELVERGHRSAGSDRPLKRPSPYNATLAWQVGLGVSLMLHGLDGFKYITHAPIPPALQRTGEQFVSAFARPLMDPSSGMPPIRARLRFVPHAEQLEIFIAPTAGRRYPTCRTTSRTWSTDINRVAQLLGTHVVVSDRLRAEGKWVVVPIRRVDLKQAGAK